MPRKKTPPTLPELLDKAYLRIDQLLSDPDLNMKDLLGVFRTLAYFKGTSTKALPSGGAAKQVNALMAKVHAEEPG